MESGDGRWMDAGVHLKFVTNLAKSARLGMFFQGFKSSVFDSYIRGPGFDKRVIVTFVDPLRI